MANSNDRSKFHMVNRKAKTESFKRSSHNDFATTSELRERKFSGWRENKLVEKYEMWIDGEIVREVTVATVMLDPLALEKTFAEYFQLLDGG